MILAIMQPYLFPYIGYFQLIKAVDKFIFYDDVNFIKKGWINRNNILINGQASMFTVPLKEVSQNSLINQTKINEELFPAWRDKFLKSIEQNYKKSPHFSVVFPVIEQVVNQPAITIDMLAMRSVVAVADYLSLNTEFGISSGKYNNSNLKAQERILDICLQEQASHYINPQGGMELYTKQTFLEKGIKLSFIKPATLSYKQFKNEFIPWLSIIDVLMFNDPQEVNKMLDNYELI